MLEIGVQSGGSLELWRNYFGDRLYLYGVDVNPYVKPMFEDLPRTRMFIGDQVNRSFWAEFRSQVLRIDIVLDDGGHTAEQQIVTFEELYEFTSKEGIYKVEHVTGGPGSFVYYAQKHVHGIFGHVMCTIQQCITRTLSG